MRRDLGGLVDGARRGGRYNEGHHGPCAHPEIHTYTLKMRGPCESSTVPDRDIYREVHELCQRTLPPWESSQSVSSLLSAALSAADAALHCHSDAQSTAISSPVARQRESGLGIHAALHAFVAPAAIPGHAYGVCTAIRTWP